MRKLREYCALRASAALDSSMPTSHIHCRRASVTALCNLVRGSQVMAVVKADGYGHGMVPAARAAS